jgi:hypothetical protein
LTGRRLALKIGDVRPGYRRMTVLIVVFPKFDPDDEVIVEEPSARIP